MTDALEATKWPTPTWGIFNQGAAEAIFEIRFAEAGYRLIHRASWATDVTDLSALDADLVVSFSHSTSGLVLEENRIASLDLDHGSITARIASNSQELIDECLTSLRESFPLSAATDGHVPVAFWSYGPNGPMMVSRKIAVAPWDVISGNYASETEAKLEEMMSSFRPSHGGQLILWQGEPGTGKTHALRSLAWEWRDWARLHYIVDPDKLFGDHADYLIQVLLADTEETVRRYVGEEVEETPGQWKVLVLEDTGELLAADAKQNTGQGLSRLLNTVDGLIGQGLRILVLVTTNEELKALHPAVSRPGRCAMQLSFEMLSREDAEDWCIRRLVDPASVTGPRSLADLYALAEEFAEKPKTRAVGFAS